MKIYDPSDFEKNYFTPHPNSDPELKKMNTVGLKNFTNIETMLTNEPII